MTDTIRQSARAQPRHRQSRRRKTSAFTVLALAAAAGIAGAAAGCHPTGTTFADQLEAAVFAALVTFVCSRASRETLLVFSAVTLVMSRSWLYIPAAAALLVAFYSVSLPHSRRRLGALVGALGVEALLRWPPIAFHGSTAAVAGAVLIPVLVSAYQRMSTAERRRAKEILTLTGTAVVVLSIPVLIAAALARTDISAGQSAAQAALGEMSNGNSALATTQLRAATAEFGNASSKLGSWWTSLANLVPVVAQQRRALAGGTVTARTLIAAAVREVPSLDYHQLNYHKGQVDLARIIAMLGPAQILDRSLFQAQARLTAIPSPWLVGPIQSRLSTFERKLGQAKASADLAVEAIPVVPSMLGSDRPRHYFVAFVTPSESRGLDGIVGAYGELTAANGHVSLTRSGPVSPDLDSALPLSGGSLTGLPDFMARYGQFSPGSYFQDVTFSPDFPTVAEVISQLYPQAGGDQIDGVLMVDPYGIAPLLSITGPIAIPGLSQPLTSKNAPEILLKGQYLTEGAISTGNTARHDLLQDALHLTFQRLVNGSLPAPRVLSRALDPSVLAGRIALWSVHPEDGPLLQALHLGDAFPKPHGGDLLAVSAQNAGANKIDAYLHQSTLDHVLFDPATGAVKATVTVSLRNDAPASGLPPIVIANPDAPGTPPGANYDWLSVYTPLALKHVTLDGASTTLSVGHELGVTVYSRWVLVPSKATTKLTLSLTGTTTPGSPYVLHLRMQPSANPVMFHATVALTNGHGSRGPQMSWTAGPSVDQSHVFQDR